MRLAEFIARDMPAILVRWDNFARTQLPAAETLDQVHLRNHAEQILNAIIADLNTAQTAQEQAQKSLGLAARSLDVPETAAQTHGMLRAKWGFDIKQLVAEYRALRASVLGLWAATCLPDATHAEDTMRFNEAIDQAVAESVGFYSGKLMQERNLLLGSLGHDMRGPLQVIRMSAGALERTDAGEKVASAALRIVRSSAELTSMLDDLVDFNRANLGLGLSVTPIHVDLAALFQVSVDHLRVAHPERDLQLDVNADVQGSYDPQRIRQLLANLVHNAFKYGARHSPVKVRLIGTSAEVLFSVVNQGSKIDPTLIRHIFDPLVRGNQQLTGADKAASLGLGLYIARQIARAHGGDITASSDDVQTSFVVRLPRLTEAIDNTPPDAM